MALLQIKTAKITERGQIAIPKGIRELEGFAEGSSIVVLAYDDHVELRSLEAVEKNELKLPETAILSEKSLAKAWNTKEEDEAWKNL